MYGIAIRFNGVKKNYFLLIPVPMSRVEGSVLQFIGNPHVAGINIRSLASCCLILSGGNPSPVMNVAKATSDNINCANQCKTRRGLERAGTQRRRECRQDAYHHLHLTVPFLMP